MNSIDESIRRGVEQAAAGLATPLPAKRSMNNTKLLRIAAAVGTLLLIVLAYASYTQIQKGHFFNPPDYTTKQQEDTRTLQQKIDALHETWGVTKPQPER